MYTKEEILKLHQLKFRGLTAKHISMSAGILEGVGKELDKIKVEYIIDKNWPYHLIAKIKGLNISLYNGGWSDIVETQILDSNGEPNKNYEEKSFTSLSKLSTYLLKLKG